MADTDQIKTMISGLAGKSVYGQLEPLMPEIVKKISEGVPRAQIHQLITEQGIKISEGTFYNYLHRYRKRNSTPAAPGKASNKQPLPPVAQNGNSEPAVVVEEPALDDSEQKSSAIDLLSNEIAREDFANQFMTRPPIRKGNKR